jgi:hypothetical protein
MRYLFLFLLIHHHGKCLRKWPILHPYMLDVMPLLIDDPPQFHISIGDKHEGRIIFKLYDDTVPLTICAHRKTFVRHLAVILSKVPLAQATQEPFIDVLYHDGSHVATLPVFIDLHSRIVDLLAALDLHILTNKGHHKGYGTDGGEVDWVDEMGMEMQSFREMERSHLDAAPLGPFQAGVWKAPLDGLDSANSILWERLPAVNDDDSDAAPTLTSFHSSVIVKVRLQRRDLSQTLICFPIGRENYTSMQDALQRVDLPL